MRRWGVKKTDTADAIVAAVINGSCTTDAQVEEIAARYGDTVEWREAKEVEGMKEYIDQEPDRRISSTNHRSITVEMVVEDAIGDLLEAHRFFSCLWDQYFSYLDKPNWWEKAYKYQEISASLTAYMQLMNRIVNVLEAAYGNGAQHFIAGMRALVEVNEH